MSPLSFDRYTDRARRAVVLAQDEARALRRREVDTDCVLLGLAAEDGGVARQALESLGAGPEAVRWGIAERIPAVIAMTGGRAAFTPAAAKAFEMAARGEEYLWVLDLPDR